MLCCVIGLVSRDRDFRFDSLEASCHARRIDAKLYGNHSRSVALAVEPPNFPFPFSQAPALPSSGHRDKPMGDDGVGKNEDYPRHLAGTGLRSHGALVQRLRASHRGDRNRRCLSGALAPLRNRFHSRLLRGMGACQDTLESPLWSDSCRSGHCCLCGSVAAGMRADCRSSSLLARTSFGSRQRAAGLSDST